MKYIYCPYCGDKLIKKEIGDEGLIPYCKKCEIPLWDTFTTSIIAAVLNEENEIALLKQKYVSSNHHVCVAGIMKPNETAEETVIREVKEEIGQEVKKIEYIGSYFYEKKETLMLAFQVLVKKQELKLSKEVDSAEWIDLEKADKYLRQDSIAYKLVKKIKNR